MECPFIIKKYGKHYYIEQTRPLCIDEFAPIVSNQSLYYVTDDAWEEGIVPTTREKKPTFSKTFTLKSIWIDKVKEQIENDIDLKNFVYSTSGGSNLKRFVNSLIFSSQSRLLHSFDWMGCKDEKSRIKKIDKNKEIFEERINQYKQREETRSYNEALRKVVESIKYVNDSVSYDLKGGIANNIPHYTQDDVETIPSYLDNEKEIQEIEATLAPLKNKLKKLREEQHSLRCNVLIEKVIKEDIPYDIKQPIIDELEKKKANGYPRMPYF
jgi:hypothetical protein